MKNFDELAEQAKAGWSENAHRVYEAASAQFTAEVAERAVLGPALAANRQARSLSQPALSEITGVQQAEISRIEKGIANPTVATVSRLAQALDQRLTLVSSGT